MSFYGVILGVCLVSMEFCRASDSDKFLQAVCAGEKQEVTRLVALHPEFVNQQFGSYGTSLPNAAQSGNLDMVGLLVEHKADINGHGPWGRTALHFAAERGDVKMVNFLLDHHADPNSRDAYGLTPIIQAGANLDIVKLLVARGADINANSGVTTLYSQVVGNPSGRLDVLQFLLDHHVDVGISQTEGLFQLILFTGRTDMLNLLVPYYANSSNLGVRELLNGALGAAMDHGRNNLVSVIVSAMTRLETKPLHLAVNRGDTNAVQELITAQPDSINAVDGLGWTPLHMAAIENQPDSAEALLSQGANPDTLDEDGNTPLYWACFLGNASVAEVLLRHHANTGLGGNTFRATAGASQNYPLDIAINQGAVSIALMLINGHVDVQETKSWGETPLHLAAAKGEADVISALLQHGTDINARRWMQQTALDIAVGGDSPDAVHVLLAGKADFHTQDANGGNLFHLWAPKGNNAVADEISNLGLDVNARDASGNTPLHLAVSSKQPQSIIWLLNHGADINPQNKDGLTPLHLAVFGSTKQIVKLLLDHGASVTITDNKGRAVLQYLNDEAEEFEGEIFLPDYREIIQLLVSHGAKEPPRKLETTRATL